MSYVVLLAQARSTWDKKGNGLPDQKADSSEELAIMSIIFLQTIFKKMSKCRNKIEVDFLNPVLKSFHSVNYLHRCKTFTAIQLNKKEEIKMVGKKRHHRLMKRVYGLHLYFKKSKNSLDFHYCRHILVTALFGFINKQYEDTDGFVPIWIGIESY